MVAIGGQKQDASDEMQLVWSFGLSPTVFGFGFCWWWQMVEVWLLVNWRTGLIVTDVIVNALLELMSLPPKLYWIFKWYFRTTCENFKLRFHCQGNNSNYEGKFFKKNIKQLFSLFNGTMWIRIWLNRKLWRCSIRERN